MVELYQTRLRGIQHRRFQKVSQVYNNARWSLRFVYRKKPKRNNRRIRRSIGLLSDLNANLQRRRPNSKSFLVNNLRSNKSNQQNNQLIAVYLKEHLQIEINQSKKEMNYLGFEIDKEALKPTIASASE